MASQQAIGMPVDVFPDADPGIGLSERVFLAFRVERHVVKVTRGTDEQKWIAMVLQGECSHETIRVTTDNKLSLLG